MSTFTFVFLCIQACLIQNALSSCLGAYGPAAGRAAALEVAGAEALAYGAAGPYGAYGASPLGAAAYGAAGYGGYGYGNALAVDAERLAAGPGAVRAGGLGVAGPYGGAGIGNLGVTGDMPVAGTTQLAGNVPVIGAVQFGGDVPAGGVVSISGNCNCGAGYPGYPIY